MRAKHKKHADERLLACGETVIGDPGVFLQGLGCVFKSDAPVHLEIGCGKGGFVLGMAQLYPDINFIAIERITDILISAAEKIKSAAADNIRLCRFDALGLADFFPEGSIERIYLNFSDPWPKIRHRKRRLTHQSFLELYKKVLAENGSVFMKTDDSGLFEFSVEELRNNGWRLENITYDLHGSGFENNIMTEYEKRFSAQGVKIKRLEAYRR